MFNLCQIVQIHEHHYHQVVVPPRNHKVKPRPHSQQFSKTGANGFFKKKYPSSNYSSQTHASAEKDQKNRKGIQVMSKQPKITDFSAHHTFTVRDSCSERQSKVSKSLYQQTCSSPTPVLSRPPKLIDIRANRAQKNPIYSLNVIEKCINAKQNLQMSSPVRQVNIPTAVEDLTHSSPHCLRPTQISISRKIKDNTIFGFASQNIKLDSSNQIQPQFEKEDHWESKDQLWKSQEYYLFKKQLIAGKKKRDLKLTDSKLQNQDDFPIRKSIKLGKVQRQLFDAMSITSFDMENLNEEINVEQSILINRKIDTFSHITPVRTIRGGQICLAVEKDINFVVCLKTFGEKEEESYLQESHLHQITEKNQTHILSLYQVLIEENYDKKIIFVQEAFEAFLDQWIEKKKSQPHQQGNIKKMMRCLEETVENVIIQFNRLEYCLVELFKLEDFVVVNDKVKLHLLTKFKHLSQCSNLKPISILQSHQNLKHSFCQKLGRQLYD